eukprot:TRINITY_DN2401_c1_g1_i2.p2 TRINITY_DN2401_c1_g1~~TRINITY_DN2401_c1_g1_i2.p2  ORF type:complete len:247 (-),score=35.18 TRINITY_DN2401_c1_g1_i2:273-1013(-)
MSEDRASSLQKLNLVADVHTEKTTADGGNGNYSDDEVGIDMDQSENFDSSSSDDSEFTITDVIYFEKKQSHLTFWLVVVAFIVIGIIVIAVTIAVSLPVLLCIVLGNFVMLSIFCVWTHRMYFATRITINFKKEILSVQRRNRPFFPGTIEDIPFSDLTDPPSLSYSGNEYDLVCTAKIPTRKGLIQIYVSLTNNLHDVCALSSEMVVSSILIRMWNQQYPSNPVKNIMEEPPCCVVASNFHSFDL